MIEPNLKLIFLGTGTSQGVPIIGSKEPVCLSTNAKDKRLRSSVYVEYKQKKILIDCGPDFRYQMLRENLSHIDAVLLTHEHNDHVIGLDDIRAINFLQKKDMPLYGLPRVLDSIKTRFPYAFEEHRYPGIPRFNLIPVHDKFNIDGLEITPLPILHGKLPILGYRIGNMAYLTDVLEIPPSTLSLLHGIDTLIIGALRKEPKHHSHLTLPEAIDMANKIGARQTFFTHMSHRIGFHEEVEKELPTHTHLAYDQLRLEIKS